MSYNVYNKEICNRIPLSFKHFELLHHLPVFFGFELLRDLLPENRRAALNLLHLPRHVHPVVLYPVPVPIQIHLPLESGQIWLDLLQGRLGVVLGPPSSGQKALQLLLLNFFVGRLLDDVSWGDHSGRRFRRRILLQELQIQLWKHLEWKLQLQWCSCTNGNKY